MHNKILLLLLLLCESALLYPQSETNSLVVRTTESTKKADNLLDNHDFDINPKISSMEIQTNISNRFAITLVTSEVKNLKNTAAETTFSVILPENAFISEFVMEIGGKSYKAYVKEKEEAKRIYQEAVSSGLSAGHVELSARDSKTFTVSVNVEAESKTIFRLTYEELLQRQIGQYELIINIYPGQIVDDLNVQVHINESRPLTFVRTPSLRTGNEISKNDDNLDPEADIKIINSTSAIVKFSPDKNQQTHFAELLGSNKENGLAGQFVVQYDVDRDPQGGEVLVRDGYFVHFFSPSKLEPLPKHVVFVLDHSRSMMGRAIEQLTEAMQNILPELGDNDFFNIIRFSYNALVWSPIENKFTEVFAPGAYGHLEPQLRESGLPGGVKATKENIRKAKEIVKDHTDMGATNIIEGLEVGLFLIKRTQEKFPNKYQPMIIFLTDGLPNVGMDSGDLITEIVTKLNSGPNRASIFSLSFGSSADKSFLRKLSSQNLGFSRHIYGAADASLQLQDFYRRISSPLLSNVTFKYVDGVTDATKSYHPILFDGSELVVAGKTNDISNISLRVDGICTTGLVHFRPVSEEPVSSLERLWAYLTVQQTLKERETATNKSELTKKALDLALKYSFVTEVSSLVVVKPNQTESVENKNLEDPEEGVSRLWGFPGVGAFHTYRGAATSMMSSGGQASLSIPSYGHGYAMPSSGGSYVPGYPAARPATYNSPSGAFGPPGYPLSGPDPFNSPNGPHGPPGYPLSRPGPFNSPYRPSIYPASRPGILNSPNGAYGLPGYPASGPDPLNSPNGPPKAPGYATVGPDPFNSPTGPVGPPGYPVSRTATFNSLNGAYGPPGYPVSGPDPLNSPNKPSIYPASRPANIPKWLEDIKNNNGNITTPQGVFKLGKVGDAVFRPQCPKTPFNVTGECRIVFHCPEIFPILTDITVYLQYFCLLNNKYAGVCCPRTILPIP